MQDEDSQFTDLRSDHINNREKILKANVLLSKRHKQMVYELNLIYPIEQVYIHVNEFQPQSYLFAYAMCDILKTSIGGGSVVGV